MQYTVPRQLAQEYHVKRKPRKQRTATLSVPEAGEMLGLSRNGAYDAARRGELPVIKIGRKLLVPRIALERMLQEARPTHSTGSSTLTPGAAIAAKPSE